MKMFGKGMSCIEETRVKALRRELGGHVRKSRKAGVVENVGE